MSESILHPGPDRLEAYLEGTLDDAERAVLESHLVTCSRCQVELEDWRGLFTALSGLPVLEPAPGFADRVMAAVQLPQPLPARIAGVFGRWLPKSTRMWAILTALLALPGLAVGGAVAWVAAQPWLTVEGIVFFGWDRAVRGATWIAAAAGHLLLETAPVQWAVSMADQLLTAVGPSGIGAAAALFGTLVVLSAWILYQNLFRTPTRERNHASLSF